MNGFKKLVINRQWQQFSNIEIDFHDRMTIITGANGSGKTTILNLLAKHFQWDSISLATPKKNPVTKIFEWIYGFLDVENDNNNIGELVYTNEVTSPIRKAGSGNVQYSLNIDSLQQVEGFYIPSHRSVFRYEHVNNLPTQSTFDKQDAFTKVSNSSRSRYLGQHEKPSNYYMKEVLISWNIFGHGNPDMPARENLLENFNSFENILKIILPQSLGFQKIEIRNFELVLICSTGEFLLDAVSGGVGTLIDLAWQIHMYSTEKRDSFTVMIDEVENHLHPIMQRRILHDLLKAFPTVRFIVSTHSPLIVSSVKDSQVIALRYRDNRVCSESLDLVHKPRTATEVLDEILGVSFTMPIWAEEALSAITNKHLNKDNFGKDDLLALRDDLKSVGLERLMPEAVYKVAEKYDQA